MLDTLTHKVETSPRGAIRIEDNEAIRNVLKLLSAADRLLRGVTGSLLFLSNSESTQDEQYREMLHSGDERISALQMFNSELLFTAMEDITYAFAAAYEALEEGVVKKGADVAG